MAETDNNQKKKFSRTLLIIFVALLVVFNAFLIFQLVKKNKDTSEQLVSTITLKEELQKELKNYEKQLAEYQKLVGDKDTALQAKIKEVEELKEKIEAIIQTGKVTQAKYDDAKEEIARLKYYTQKYQKDIEDLKQKNEILTTENEGLKEEVKEVKREVDKLTDENVNLTNKVSLGAILKAGNIDILGIQVKGGKQKETNKGDKMDGLKISFNILENTIAKTGERVFYFKILNPKGETLYMEERGSGQFQYLGEQSLYTLKESFDFQNSVGDLYKVYWAKGSPFEKGNYKIQIFTDGSKIGEKSFIIQ